MLFLHRWSNVGGYQRHPAQPTKRQPFTRFESLDVETSDRRSRRLIAVSVRDEVESRVGRASGRSRLPAWFAALELLSITGEALFP